MVISDNRERLDSDYDKRNISVVISDIDFITVNKVKIDKISVERP